MGLFSFNKRIKHRRFDYTPRYYDPEKEALKERIEQYSGDQGDLNKAKSRIKSGLRQKYRADQSYKKALQRKSNVRLIMIILILLFLSYMLLQSDRIFHILDSFTNG